MASPGNKIIFNGPDKTDEQLVTAARNNSLIHIDHFDELYSLIKLSEELHLKPRVAIRVNMDTGIYPKWDRFGFNYENGQAWNAITRILNDENLNLVGLHCHIGTFMLETRSLRGSRNKTLRIGMEHQGETQQDHSISGSREAVFLPPTP